ncbi:hypothetical protein AeMF1_011494 [Aphanomyces euteiches]|nr:hypothetical protein AeMF1_011494 [Aphanomyces euteiches]KAH9188689.1 hypothetical protein AeNC1_009333 [Aphanomyces euteiches]
MSSALPPGWTAYKTQDGKEYYYNAQTKVTQWDRPKAQGKAASKAAPAGSPPASSSKPPIAGGGGDRGGLLAQIQQGTKLKKTVTRESTPLDAVKGSSSSSSASSPSPGGGGGGNPLFAAIAGGVANLKKTGRSTVSRNDPSPATDSTPPSSSGGGGGFADIMRKNREASARKASIGGNPSSSSSGNVSPVHSAAPVHAAASSFRKSLASLATSSDNSELEAQLNRIEAKLDKLLAHFNIN